MKYRVSESEWANRNEQLRGNKLKDTPWKPLCLDIVWRVRNLGNFYDGVIGEA